MVAVKTEVATPGQRMKARIQRVKDMKRLEGVRVEPSDDTMRRLLKHPTAGGFRSSGDIEWPNDTFTKRRLKEGSVKLVEEKKGEQTSTRHHKREEG
jgi:hypothetical protein